MSKAKQLLQRIDKRRITVRIVGTSPLIQHKWSVKAAEAMRDTMIHGKKTKPRGVRIPEEEGVNAGYYTEDGAPGVLAVAIKCAIVDAAHNSLGIPKTLVRKSLFIHPAGREVVIPLETASCKGKVKQVIEEDMVRVGNGASDFRFRPYYYDWATTTEWTVDAGLLQMEDFLTLIDRAGFGVGINEWRPEKGGEYGRFQIDTKFKVKECAV